MAKSIVIAAFLLAATAGVAAYGQDNKSCGSGTEQAYAGATSG